MSVCADIRRLLRLPDTIGMGFASESDAPSGARCAHRPLSSTGSASTRRAANSARGRRCAAEALDALGHVGVSAPLPASPAGIPVWPSGYVGSISHSDRAAIALASSRADHTYVGVDLEPLSSAEYAAQIAALVGTDAEFTELGDLAFPMAVLVVFCAKEALYKALLPGRVLDFDAARLRRIDDFAVELELMTRWSAAFDRGRTIIVRWASAINHVLAAVAV